MVGEDIVNYLRSLRQRLDYLKEHGQYWTFATDGEPIQALFLEKSDTISDDPSFGIYAFIESEGKENEIQALVYPDRRGNGYGLTRYDDSQRLNFSQCNRNGSKRPQRSVVLHKIIGPQFARGPVTHLDQAVCCGALHPRDLIVKWTLRQPKLLGRPRFL